MRNEIDNIEIIAKLYCLRFFVSLFLPATIYKNMYFMLEIIKLYIVRSSYMDKLPLDVCSIMEMMSFHTYR